MKFKAKIGIIGGNGPQVSSEVYQYMIKMATEKYAATNNHEYPEIVIHSLPLVDFISDKRNAKSGKGRIAESIKNLENQSCDYIAITCNTVHIFEKDYINLVGNKFVSIIGTVIEAVKAKKHQRIGILASRTTIKSNLYQQNLEKLGIKSLFVNKEEEFKQNKLIRKIIANHVTSQDKLNFKRDLEMYSKRLHLDGIILGCTELSIFGPNHLDIPIYKSHQILADKLLELAYNRRVD